MAVSKAVTCVNQGAGSSSGFSKSLASAICGSAPGFSGKSRLRARSANQPGSVPSNRPLSR